MERKRLSRSSSLNTSVGEVKQSETLKENTAVPLDKLVIRKKFEIAPPLKSGKRNLLSAFLNDESEVSFNKPSRIRTRKERNSCCRSTVFQMDSYPLENMNSVSKNPHPHMNLATLQKLGLKHQELEKAVSRVRQAFSSHKVSTYFCLDRNFINEYEELLDKMEKNTLSMGQALQRVLLGFESSGLVVNNSDDNYLSEEIELNKNHAHHGSLTPPVSEVGNYDNMDDGIVLKKLKLALVNDDEERILPERRVGICHQRNKYTTTGTCLKEPQINSAVSSDKFDSVTLESTLKDSQDNRKTDGKEENVEYEVEKIKDYLKKLGQYYYHVSWKGYGSEDDTFEPADNLTGCDEALVLFFKERLLQRRRVQSVDELKLLILPCDPSVKETMFEGFERTILPLSTSEKERLVRVLVSAKPPTLSGKDELKEDLLKLLSTKDLSSERYQKKYSSLVQTLSLLIVNEEREKQQACLRAWERNMNLICTDPSPLKVENDVDLALPPLDFIYTNDYIAGPNVIIPDDPMVGCECEECNSGNRACCADQMGSCFAYNKFGRLRISLGTPIYECNKMCKCPPSCFNRIVQRRRRIALSIFRTSNGRGWGVKALENIKKETFVTEYVGEVISSEEAELRGTKYDARGCTYLFDLDYNKGEQNPYTVDAAKCGNVSHFINHSCDPNLVVYNVWINCLDPDLPKLALFAISDIKKGEEITFDYNSGSMRQVASIVAEKIDQGGLTFDSASPVKSFDSDYSPDYILNAPKNRNGKTECLCGAANCRKFFF